MTNQNKKSPTKLFDLTRALPVLPIHGTTDAGAIKDLKFVSLVVFSGLKME